MSATSSFDNVAKIADAVLLEGYVLYPYRATSAKNRYRWTFGVVAPQCWSEAGGCEPSWIEAQIPVSGESPIVRGRLRFLRVVSRRVERRDADGWREVDMLTIGTRTLVPWEEGEITEIDFEARADGETSRAAFLIPASVGLEPVSDESGAVVARIVREKHDVAGTVDARLEEIADDGEGLFRLSVRVTNETPFEPKAPRNDAVRAAFVSAHVVCSIEGGRFLSVVDPPPFARAVAEKCKSVRLYPVLAGEVGREDLVLASPIILYDHPGIAPESPGDFFDASEIDELLALRTRTLTPEERALARATDPRAAEIVDRALALTDEELARLHGAVRDRPTPNDGRFRVGTKVRLRPDPERRRTDVQDLVFAGHTATIEAIKHDVDGRVYLAVIVDDDPAAEMHRSRGLYHYYYPDEVESL